MSHKTISSISGTTITVSSAFSSTPLANSVWVIENDSLSLPKCEQRGKIIKALSTRLKGKEGRIRGNLMGKRVDYSARTVITPDPCIDMDQLGIPKRVAMNITFPEIVTRQNMDHLRSQGEPYLLLKIQFYARFLL